MTDMKTDLLLVYVREDGAFGRLIHDGRTFDKAVRDSCREETVKGVLRTLTECLIPEGASLAPRSVVVAYAISRRVTVQTTLVEETLSELPFADSVSELRRDEVFFSAATVLSREEPCQVLYCDSRETRLFTAEGEIPLAFGKTGGNGFVDFLMSFAENENDSVEYFSRQYERLNTLFRAYRCIPPAEETEKKREKRLFPSEEVFPHLSARPAQRDPIFLKKRDAAAEIAEEIPARNEAPIRYYALKSFDRARVDRKYPALYRTVRDRRGNYKQISMGEAVEAFRKLFVGLETAPLTRVIAVGQYARFPLLTDLLASLPRKPQVLYGSESHALLDGMEYAVLERLDASALILRDIDGQELPLWKRTYGGVAPEKRVSLAVTLKLVIPKEEWRKKMPILPYTMESSTLERAENGDLVRRQIRVTGDLRESCYRKHRDGSYRLKLPTLDGDSAFRRVVLGLGATPLGICCHLLSDESACLERR